MEIRDLFSELKRYQIRLTLSFVFILLCFLVIFIKLFFLQIVEYEKYKKIDHELLKKNGIKVIFDGRNLLKEKDKKIDGIDYIGIGVVKNLSD